MVVRQLKEKVQQAVASIDLDGGNAKTYRIAARIESNLRSGSKSKVLEADRLSWLLKKAMHQKRKRRRQSPCMRQRTRARAA